MRDQRNAHGSRKTQNPYDLAKFESLERAFHDAMIGGYRMCTVGCAYSARTVRVRCAYGARTSCAVCARRTCDPRMGCVYRARATHVRHALGARAVRARGLRNMCATVGRRARHARPTRAQAQCVFVPARSTLVAGYFGETHTQRLCGRSVRVCVEMCCVSFSISELSFPNTMRLFEFSCAAAHATARVSIKNCTCYTSA